MSKMVRLMHGVEVANFALWNSCVHCGYCCREAPCGLAKELNEWHEGDCDGLEKSIGTGGLFVFKCKHAVEYAKELNIGVGCCSQLNSERIPHLEAVGAIRRMP